MVLKTLNYLFYLAFHHALVLNYYNLLYDITKNLNIVDIGLIKMNANTKLEIAVEIMAAKIAKTSREEQSEEKIEKLLKEKTKMYQGDNEIIEKIINVYGKYLDFWLYL